MRSKSLVDIPSCIVDLAPRDYKIRDPNLVGINAGHTQCVEILAYGTAVRYS